MRATVVIINSIDLLIVLIINCVNGRRVLLGLYHKGLHRRSLCIMFDLFCSYPRSYSFILCIHRYIPNGSARYITCASLPIWRVMLLTFSHRLDDASVAPFHMNFSPSFLHTSTNTLVQRLCLRKTKEIFRNVYTRFFSTPLREKRRTLLMMFLEKENILLPFYFHFCNKKASFKNTGKFCIGVFFFSTGRT